jgi:hypothetical protein
VLHDGEHFGTVHAERSGYEKSAARSVYFDGSSSPTIDLRLRAKGD